jgi:hypothetical protein
LLGRQPDQETFEKLSAQFSQCGLRADCLRARRLDVATTLLTQNELPTSGLFLHALYSVGLGRRPHLTEYESDRKEIRNYNGGIEDARLALVQAFVGRTEFEKKYPKTLNKTEFVDQILSAVLQGTDLDLKNQREAFLAISDGTSAGRAAVLAAISAQSNVLDSQYNQAFVLAQYFGYLRRDPDDSGFNFWVNVLKSKPLRDPDSARSMVCAFLTSTEYQNRFGMLATHNSGECGN